jgi:hypothetical protein
LGLPILTNLNDFGGDCGCAGGPSGAIPTDPLECFTQELLDLSTMNGDNGPDISAVLDDLPVQQRGEVARISMQEAVDVCCLILYIICYIICNNRCICLGWILAASMQTRQYSFHKSKSILMDDQKLKMMSVQSIKDLFKDVLHNKDFHPDGVDNNMHGMLYIISYMISYCWNYYHTVYSIFLDMI